MVLPLAALGSLGMGIYGAVSGPPSSGVGLPQPLPGVRQAGKDVMSSIPGLSNYNVFGQDLPQAQGVSQSLFNNPFAGDLQGAAGTAGAMGMGAGANMFGAGGNLYGAGTSAINMGMDPQSLLYNRTAQQLQDQQRTASAAAGVATTPYGAGLEGQTMSNFNIDWQNNALMRAIQGLQAGGQAYGQAGQMQQQAPLEYMYGGGLPYGTFNQIGQGQLGALTAGGQFGQSAANIPQQQISDYSGYAQGGQGLANQTAGLGLQQAQQGFNQSQQMGQGIGWGLGALSNSPMMRGWGSPTAQSANNYNLGQSEALGQWGSYFGGG